uniref:Uncharacterized protein n=1 Tax=Ditylenchus dipsaci TaxID=166011 RepID=A0A915EI16_9BILA
MENPPDQHDILTTTNNNVDTSFSKDNRNSSSRSWNGAAAEKTAGMSSCEEVVRNGGSQRAVKSGNSSKTNCSTAKSARMSTVTPIQSTSSNCSQLQQQQSAVNPPLA